MTEDDKQKPGDPAYWSGAETMAAAVEGLNDGIASMARNQAVRQRKMAEAAIRNRQPRPKSVPEDYWERVQTEAIKWSKSSGQDVSQFGLEGVDQTVPQQQQELATKERIENGRRFVSAALAKPGVANTLLPGAQGIGDEPKPQNDVAIEAQRAEATAAEKRGWWTKPVEFWTVIGGVCALLAFVGWVAVTFVVPAVVTNVPTPIPTP